MGVSVTVMPLRTNLRGDFEPAWGDPRVRRTELQARDAVEAFLARLEGLLGFRPDWDDEGPVRSATVFSADGFDRPFLQARRWSYRLKLPRLSALEIPQIWLPADFEPAFRFEAPWSPGAELGVASSPRLLGELELLMNALAEDPAREETAEFAETGRLAARLRAIAGQSVEHGLPAIVEG